MKPLPAPVTRAALPLKRSVFRLLRAGIVRYMRASPREDERGEKVFILLVSAWGMGGTIRAAINLANYLVDHRDVEIISAYRRREEPYFAFVDGVRVTPLDDQRPGCTPRRLRLVRRLLRSRKSVLIHPADIRYHNFSLWTDLRLARILRGQRGVVIGTRPGLNLLVADAKLPGLAAVGVEQMHLQSHAKSLKRAMLRRYGNLDGLAVLTEQDRAEYAAALNGTAPPMWRIPNTVRDVEPPRADLGSKTILAAGRYTWQKGFDFLIPAFALVAGDHPDWHLRICGSDSRKDYKKLLVGQIEEHGLQERVTLAGPSTDLPGEMARASIYALSSRYEGFPLVLIEAMSKGMAVVAYDCPTGPADIVDDRRNGILVPYKDVPAFADGLRAFMEDVELRRSCADAALETARDYTMAAIGPSWDELLQALLPERA